MIEKSNFIRSDWRSSLAEVLYQRVAPKSELLFKHITMFKTFLLILGSFGRHYIESIFIDSNDHIYMFRCSCPLILMCKICNAKLF